MGRLPVISTGWNPPEVAMQPSRALGRARAMALVAKVMPLARATGLSFQQRLACCNGPTLTNFTSQFHFKFAHFFLSVASFFSSKHDLDPGKDGKGKGKGKEDPDAPPKEQPNFEPSGLLALEDNAKNGIPLKFTVPAEARRPATKWRLYVFAKQNEGPKMIHIYKNVAFRRPDRTFVLHFEVWGVDLWHAKTQWTPMGYKFLTRFNSYFEITYRWLVTVS